MSQTDITDSRSQAMGKGSNTTVSEIPRSISVIVTSMPETPAKSLWKDSARLLSLAAFIFSLVTGLYAAYSTWKTQRDTAVDDVGKLINQYYEKAEKLKTINQYVDTGYFNLLRTQQRSEAAQAVRKALDIEKYIDNGTWMSLAQINGNEQNCNVSQDAWLSALRNTNDISEYLFSLRGIATNEGCLRKTDDAIKHLQQALKAVSSDEVAAEHAIKNNFQRSERSLEVYRIHVVWMSLFPAENCEVLVPHYDAATAAFAEAFRDVPSNDKAAQRLVADARSPIDRFKEARTKCS